MTPRARLDQDLKAAVSRLRQLGAAAVEERPGTIGGHLPLCRRGRRNPGRREPRDWLAARELVLERVNRLSAALDRMNAGEYGTCA